jgi:hypothetical protein
LDGVRKELEAKVKMLDESAIAENKGWFFCCELGPLLFADVSRRSER